MLGPSAWGSNSCAHGGNGTAPGASAFIPTIIPVVGMVRNQGGVLDALLAYKRTLISVDVRTIFDPGYDCAAGGGS
jgi:hypothetical protein